VTVRILYPGKCGALTILYLIDEVAEIDELGDGDVVDAARAQELREFNDNAIGVQLDAYRAASGRLNQSGIW